MPDHYRQDQSIVAAEEPLEDDERRDGTRDQEEIRQLDAPHSRGLLYSSVTPLETLRDRLVRRASENGLSRRPSSSAGSRARAYHIPGMRATTVPRNHGDPPWKLIENRGDSPP